MPAAWNGTKLPDMLAINRPKEPGRARHRRFHSGFIAYSSTAAYIRELGCCRSGFSPSRVIRSASPECLRRIEALGTVEAGQAGGFRDREESCPASGIVRHQRHQADGDSMAGGRREEYTVRTASFDTQATLAEDVQGDGAPRN